MLTLPGWWLEIRPSMNPRLCRVANPKCLQKWLGEAPTILNATKRAAEMAERRKTFH
jgi:hypothetical protein